MTALGDAGPVTIVGAGQAGSLLALYLARRGHHVEVYESRPDLRRVDIDAGRSINLALATRGLVPLRAMGVETQVRAITVPLGGRMIHAEGVDGHPGAVSFQPYGSSADEVIESVSRSDLNAILFDAAEATGRVKIHFEHYCHRVDLDRRTLVVGPYATPSTAREVDFGTLFACDGAGSEARDAIVAASGGSIRNEPLDHGYKELTIPAGPDGEFLLDPNALHIWPRRDFMLIALANPEGDFTVTLFMRNAGASESFASLDTTEAVTRFFAREFPDFVALVPNLTDQFAQNPVGTLSTVRVNGWSVDDRAVLVGDAAHAIVPFHGQGMNLAMESCRLLDEELERTPNDVAAAFASFEKRRKPDAEAIADMALDNYVEMRSAVLDPEYLLRRQLALDLETRHPDRIAARYGMVMFTTMPYAEVAARNQQQQAVFTELTKGITSISEVDFDRAAVLVEQLGPLPQWR